MTSPNHGLPKAAQKSKPSGKSQKGSSKAVIDFLAIED